MTNQVNILGNRIDCFRGYGELYEHVLQASRTGLVRHGYVTVNNVHTIMEGYWHPSFRAIINEGYLSIPDGKPLAIVGRLKGNTVISRLFGPTVMESFIDWGRKDGASHFFLGSSEQTLIKLQDAIERKYPGTKIVGMVSPPFLPIDKWDHEALVTQINVARPDFIWIGLGAPKQERWMHRYYHCIEKGILFGIGAGFDYLAGNTRHAPEWMKRAALEWLYRLAQEPQRLWRRYLKTIPPFIFHASLEVLKAKFKKK